MVPPNLLQARSFPRTRLGSCRMSREARARPRHGAGGLLFAGQPALLKGILDASGLGRFDLDGDGIQRLLHGEEQVARHVNGRGSGFDLDEENMIAVDDDLSAFIDPAQLYQGHNFQHSASGRMLFKSLYRLASHF